MRKPNFQLQAPINRNNPYDYLGQLHNYLTKFYYGENPGYCFGFLPI